MGKFARWIGGIAILCILAGLVFWQTGNHIVVRLPSGFFPKVVHIEKNDSITFINLTGRPSSPAAGPHPSHSSYADFDAQEGIASGRFWKFTFAEEGAYTFHDHYAPEMNGIIISGSNDISLITDQEACTKISDHVQQNTCIEIYFRNVTERVGYPQARAIYEDIAVRYPTTCHNLAHDLGKNAYKAYLMNALPQIGQEASSCAYGFWHGFTTAMQADRGFAASKEFCSSFTGETEELRVVNRMNCYHGIGIGLIPDPPPPHLWGDFQRVIGPALDFCDTVTGDPLYEERCLTGVFHAMTTYMVNGLYGFTLNENSLSYCGVQKPEHQYTCFITLVTMIPLLTEFDLEYTLEILQEHSPEDLFSEMFLNAAIMHADAEAAVGEMGNFTKQCGALRADLQQICIQGVINKLFSNGAPGIEYVKAIEFCSGPWIPDVSKQFCFTQIISHAMRVYTPEKLELACSDIPSIYRPQIQQCTISSSAL